jgi:hypothetical protein
MRTLLAVASLAAMLGLTACEQSKSEANEAAPAPAAKKLLSRSAPLYAGQEQILSVDTASVEPGKNGALTLKAAGKTPTAGYYDLAFLPRINPAPPADGIYDVDVIGYKPQTAAAAAVTPVETKGEWSSYPKERLKGVRFVSRTNSVVVMLPPAKG